MLRIYIYTRYYLKLWLNFHREYLIDVIKRRVIFHARDDKYQMKLRRDRWLTTAPMLRVDADVWLGLGESAG